MPLTPSSPIHGQIRDFLDYLVLERGLSGNTRMGYQRDLAHFTEWINQEHRIQVAKDIRREHILDYLQGLRSRGFAATTLSRRLSAIRMFFRHLVSEGRLTNDVTDVLENPRLWKNLPSTLSEDQITSMLDQPDAPRRLDLRDKAMIEVLYGCGLRVSELCSLRMDDLRLAEGYLRVTGKGNKERVVPIGSRATEAIQAYMRQLRPRLARHGNPVQLFLNYRGEGMTRAAAFQIVRQRKLAAGISDKASPHTLRHSFASHLMQHGAPLRVIQEILGHADIATTQIYTHVDTARLKSIHQAHHPRA